MGVRMSSSAPTSVIMKFLVLAASLSVCSAQGFFGLVGHPNGAVTPVDEPAVAAARAEHLITKFGAAHVAVATAAPLAAAASLSYAAVPAAYAPSYGYAAPLAGLPALVAPPNGAVPPVDEPAVAAARAEHLATKGAVYAAQAPVVAAAPAVAYAAAPAAYAPTYGYAGPLNLNVQLVAHPNGAVVPIDEPAVAAARAEHLTTQGAVYAAQAPVVAAAPVGAYAAAPAVAYAATPVAAYAPAPYAGPLAGVPALVARPNGAVVPADEPAVAAARADHLLSKGVYGGVYAGAAPVAAYGGLVAHPNGAVVPVDEPAVAAARAEHLALQGWDGEEVKEPTSLLSKFKPCYCANFAQIC